MKRMIVVFAAFALVTLITVAAQAESKGGKIFSQKCAMCHSVNGKGGAIGPDLSKVSAKLKEKDIRAKLENPKKTNPNSLMPSFETLPPADLSALLRYLKALK